MHQNKKLIAFYIFTEWKKSILKHMDQKENNPGHRHTPKNKHF